MPVFGKTLFETVLDGLEPDREEAEETPSVRRSAGLGAAFFAGMSDGGGPDRGDFAGLYSDYGEGLPARAATIQPPPEWLGRLSRAEIAEDLGLADCVSDTDFRERRRAFARANHPDMVHPDFRGPATIRMTMANRLIDDAIARLDRQG